MRTAACLFMRSSRHGSSPDGDSKGYDFRRLPSVRR